MSSDGWKLGFGDEPGVAHTEAEIECPPHEAYNVIKQPYLNKNNKQAFYINSA